MNKLTVLLTYILLLSPAYAGGSEQSNQMLHDGIVNNDKVAVEKALNAGVDIETTFENGMTPLMIAIKEEKKEITSLLLDKNPNLWAVDSKGKGALFYCKSVEMAKIVAPRYKELAPLSNFEFQGMNPAMYVADREYGPDLAKYYIDQGIDVTIAGPYGLTLLHYLALSASDTRAAMDMAIKKGAEIEALNRNNETPLFKALQNNANISNIEFLVSKGANVNTPSSDGMTALHFAATSKNIEVIKLLVSKGADILAKNSKNESPFMLSCGWGDKEAVEFYLSKIPKVNNDDPDMGTAFILSAQHPEISDLLLANGFDIDIKDNNGNTALHAVADSGGYERIEYLLDKGADVNARNKNGDTPAHLVQTTEYQFVRDIADLLVSRGANLDIKNNEGISPRKKITEIRNLPSNAGKLYKDIKVVNGQIEIWGTQVPIPSGYETVRCSITNCIYSMKVTSFDQDVKNLNSFYSGKMVGNKKFDELKKSTNFPGYEWKGGTGKGAVSIAISDYNVDLTVWIYRK